MCLSNMSSILCRRDGLLAKSMHNPSCCRERSASDLSGKLVFRQLIFRMSSPGTIPDNLFPRTKGPPSAVRSRSEATGKVWNRRHRGRAPVF